LRSLQAWHPQSVSSDSCLARRLSHLPEITCTIRCAGDSICDEQNVWHVRNSDGEVVKRMSPYGCDCVCRRIFTREAAQRSRRSNDDVNTSMDSFHGSLIARLVSNVGSRSPAITIRSRLTRNILATRMACSESITITRSASLTFDCVMGRDRYRDRSRPRCALSATDTCGTGRSLPTKPADVTVTSGKLRCRTA
jgi:hypothetical protein